MNKKRNLPGELGIKHDTARDLGALDVSVDRIKDMVKARIDPVSAKRRYNTMRSKKKIFAIAAAAVLTLGITAFAASGIVKNWNSSSNADPEYKTLPAQEQCIDDIGYAPVLIGEFENGYKFASGSVVNNDLRDENNNSVEKFRSVMFRYEKEDATVLFSQDKYASELEDYGEAVAAIDGVDLYYFNYTNKIVPFDYKMTEEDKKAEKSGELTFSYGSPEMEVAVNEVSGMHWKMDGIRYELMQINGELTAAELTDMAEQIISGHEAS